MLLLLLGPWLVASEDVRCPLIFECSEMNSTICLNATTNTVVLNNNQCANYEDSCSFRDITDAIKQAYDTDEMVVVYCQSGRHTGIFDDMYQLMDDICNDSAYYRSQRLKNGQPLFQCHDRSDCELENGDFANCTCANLVAKSFCELNYGDDIMEPIYSAACRNDTRMFQYYLSFKLAYLSSLNPPRCSLSIFENIVYTSQIIEVGFDNETMLLQGAAYLSVALAALLWSL